MSNNPSQNNPTSNNTHELNFTGTSNGLNNYSNILPPTTSQNTSYLDTFYGHNYDSYTMNNNIFSAHPSTDNNVYHHTQPMPDNPSNINQTPLQNAFSPISPVSITINSPQTNIIIMPISSSDMQNMQSQLQQGHNHFLSTDNSRTQFQQ